MGNTLETPKTDKDSHEFVSYTSIQIGTSGMQGWRLEMEDAHISADFPSKPDHLLLAVFDGHAGSGSAEFAAKNLIDVIERSPKWKQYVNSNRESPELLGEILTTSFMQLDEFISEHQERSNGADTSGCTSVVCVVTPSYIICANAGDSRCVLGYLNKQVKPLSYDHKPLNKEEKKRIEGAGGYVQWNRVDGDLAVSRALGDFFYKNRTDLPAEDQKVSSKPEIVIHERQENDCVLLLACDGLWDVLTNEEAVKELHNLYEKGERKPKKMAEDMLDIALTKGSKDNISAVVAILPGECEGEVPGLLNLYQRAGGTAHLARMQDCVDNDDPVPEAAFC